MACSPSHLARKHSSPGFRSTLKLARWQIRQTWRLLLVIGVGILLAVVLLCAVPLYAQIVISAGGRGAQSATPEGPFVTVHAIGREIAQAPTY